MSDKKPAWRGADIAKLKRLYPILSRPELEREFAPRSFHAIRHMARKIGAVRPPDLGGKRRWKKIADSHAPVFVLPTDVEIKYRRPWS